MFSVAFCPYLVSQLYHITGIKKSHSVRKRCVKPLLKHLNGCVCCWIFCRHSRRPESVELSDFSVPTKLFINGVVRRSAGWSPSTVSWERRYLATVAESHIYLPPARRIVIVLLVRRNCASLLLRLTADDRCNYSVQCPQAPAVCPC